MKKIELKGLCNEVEITLNNLLNCRIEESEGGVEVVFDTTGMKVEEKSDKERDERDGE